MRTIFYVLFAIPVVLWALGGFKVAEFIRETPKVIGWYVVIGALYFFLID